VAAARFRSSEMFRNIPIPPPPVASPDATSDGMNPAPTLNFALEVMDFMPPVDSWMTPTNPLAKSVLGLLAMYAAPRSCTICRCHSPAATAPSWSMVTSSPLEYAPPNCQTLP
jgi:hypothetical protein